MTRFSLAIFSAGFLSLAPFCRAADGISAIPFPWVIAHRGGSMLFPEETVEAYDAVTAAGNPFVEVDCWMLADGAIGLMHDATLERTTTGHGMLSDLDAHQLGDALVDGRKLLGPPWTKYHVPFLDEVLVRFGNKKIIFVEAKDLPTRKGIVARLKMYRVSPEWVVVNAFGDYGLEPAMRAGYKVCLNLEPGVRPKPKQLRKRGYWAVAVDTAVPEQYVRELKAAGLKVLIYTILRQGEREKYLQWGVDGFYTDDPLYLEMSGAHRRNTDPYKAQTWAAGMLAAQFQGRGYFTPPDKWGLDASDQNVFRSCLQGWMCPLGGQKAAAEWSMELSVTFGSHFQDARWACVAIFTSDGAFNNDLHPSVPLSGYNILFYNNGGLALYRYDGIQRNTPLLLKDCGGRAIPVGETVRYRISTWSDRIRVERLDGKTAIEIEDATYRGGYVTFGAKGQKADFSNVILKVTP